MPFIPKKELESLLLAGQQLSNICFNLRKSRSLCERDQTSMDETYKSWDKARDVVRQIVARKAGR